VESSPPSQKYLPEVEMEPDIRYSPMRPASSSPKWIIWAIVSLIILIMFFLMLRLCAPKPAIINEPSVEKTTVEKPGAADEPQASNVDIDQDETNVRKQPVYELPEDSLQGTAPLSIKPNGPVVSNAVDPEIAAAVAALKIRVEIIEGTKITTKAGITTTSSSGSFLGFKINHIYQQKNDEVLRDEIVVNTPSRGIITVKGNILDSMKKTDYQTFQNDLDTAGIEVIKNELTSEGVMNVQLRMSGSLVRTVTPEFLIGPRSVGPVELGMSLKKMESTLAKSYQLVAKKLAEDDTYYDTFKVLDSRDQPLFFIIGSAGKVIGIQVVSSKYKTSRGIGLGNSLGEFRICYLKNGKVNISTTPVGIPFVSTPGMTVVFFLQGQGLNFISQVFPDDLKISDILVGNSPFVK
ncbi:MAG: hypothetical protein MUF15_04385, partial [Acidobacteria bacterium]|nr:hypothetical protein [Acidobacteriota bacterium]